MIKVLVACVGNIFLQDDGFGSAVARALQSRAVPADARVVDYGISSVHLTYELLNGYDVLVLVDTVSQQDGPPGTLYVIEPEPPHPPEHEPLPIVTMDAHDLSPGGVMALVPTLGGCVDRILVVGCQPLSIDEGLGLTSTVSAAVEPAADLVLKVIDRELNRLAAEIPAGQTGQLSRGGG